MSEPRPAAACGPAEFGYALGIAALGGLGTAVYRGRVAEPETV